MPATPAAMRRQPGETGRNGHELSGPMIFSDERLHRARAGRLVRTARRAMAAITTEEGLLRAGKQAPSVRFALFRPQMMLKSAADRTPPRLVMEAN